MPTYPIQDFKVNTLPLIGVPNSRYYVPNGQGTDVDEYITDLSGGFHKVNPVILTSSISIFATLGEVIGGGFLVYLNGNLAFKFNQNDTSLYGLPVGITNQSGIIGDSVKIIVNGECNQMGGLIPGLQYFAGNAGLNTNVVPSTGIVQPIGVAKTDTIMIVNLQKPYIKI